ncbi:DUF2846 domain-containing protein [Nitrosomonas sp. HPC101]|uniref:DUF2846 domain-containing protein n=1 Tax=Nitrosomonas sp. HPC101 TaxID=1658667 RepID=UPI001961232B|nr:DUF2846 domain-containing protein [Nitrosomonas sp. HPC101]MXS86342.1 DUF2846 domain-containing protein [Nitrosomonas sp. HPC101]
MSKIVVVAGLTLSSLAGCASVPMESTEKSAEAKKFIAPNNGKSGVYVYRSGSFGGALKKDIWIDGKCIGETAPNMFFYEEVKGDAEHKLSTESEFSPNDLMLTTSAGKNYFVRQYIKMGVFVGGAGLELVNDDEGKKEVSQLSMAQKGVCSQ